MCVVYDEPTRRSGMPTYGRVAEARGWACSKAHVGAGLWAMPVSVWRGPDHHGL
jgi:hypothetical protein